MKTSKTILALAIALLSVSCSRQLESTSKGEGGFSVKATLPETKAAYTSEELLSNALVKVYYADFSGLVRNYKYSEVPETIYLPANEYRVDIIAGEASKEAPALASWEQKSYKGSSPVTITAGVNTSVTVNAGVNNAISKVNFDATVAENFNAGYTLTVGVGENKLVYDASKNGAEGYFIITGVDEPAFEWAFSGVRTSDNSNFAKTGAITGIEAGKSYEISLKYTIKDGVGTFDLLVDYSTINIKDNIVFEAVSTGLAASTEYEIWAGHATVHADIDEGEFSDPSKIKFAYSADGSTWTTVDAVRVSEGTYKAVLSELNPTTEYTYKLVIDGEDIGDPMTLTTDVAPQLPNSSFEYNSTSASGNYEEWFNPNAPEEDCRTAWWGSGNGSAGVNGSADFGGFIISKPDTKTYTDGSQSACLASTWAVVKFAAGNLFTGSFAGLVGTTGGKVNFGRPFTARPTAIKIDLKYSSGQINHIDSKPDGVNITTNDYDWANVVVALGIWDNRTYGGTKDSPVQVNTTDKSTFVNYATDAKTVAFGDLTIQGNASNSTNEWVTYTIPLTYNSENIYPTHIILNCAASKYGDYFTGYDESTLWVDNVRLVYE
ncbi:MAG: PCMD domain-containing protein [Bacteroidales bacterium]|nr:PCMD domain-containing protein [Bacteroidales bacterium]